ncbi:19506_t:CDS:2 [Entrophospora sp. SA101]|nr:11558_t:CDS:2 [Entrophospora candida]CAH1763605.1 1787_t:CDS:2 [Entrophospora sp. SA101]CAG8563706.1 10529_t:CDS:2 [Entrophospora candida]CAJ0753505.1 20460_t:CDS:2 [Entrophospora sp. SA101]CAJ0762919.1 19506_t:CDS:2 [Entrophospora sp. SA101]
MDTDWCIMCDSHCNTSVKECKMQDRLEESVRTKKSPSSYNYDVMKASKLTASSKLLNQQHQQFLFYHRSPISRHQHYYYNKSAKKIINNNLVAINNNLNNANTNNISRSLYV